MYESGPLDGFKQADPVLDADTGLLYCPWEASYTLSIPTGWTSGVYLAKLTNAEGYDNYIVFTVRDDDRTADFLYQQPVTTYQLTWELDLVMWLEKNGYDVNYATDIDLHRRGFELLKPYQALLSAGHDEYWSKPMYDAAEMARDSGIDLAFFGANAVYWQMRLEESADGTPNRVMVAYKDANLDPETDPELKTLRWRDLGRAEQALVGIQFIADGEFSSDGSTNADYVVINSVGR